MVKHAAVLLLIEKEIMLNLFILLWVWAAVCIFLIGGNFDKSRTAAALMLEFFLTLLLWPLVPLLAMFPDFFGDDDNDFSGHDQ